MARPFKPESNRKTKHVRIPVTPETHKQLTEMAARTERSQGLADVGRNLLEAWLSGSASRSGPDVVLKRMTAASDGSAAKPAPENPIGQLVRLLGNIGLSGDFEIDPVEADRYIRVPDIVRVPNPDCYVLIGVGDSMTSESAHSIPNGSHILFCPSSAPQVGDIVHLEWDGSRKCSVKKFGGRDGDEYRFVALNPDHEEIRCKVGEVEVRGVRCHHWMPGA